MVSIIGISTVTAYFIGVLLIIQCQVSSADDGINWSVQWEYSPKCDSADDAVECLKLHMDHKTNISLTIKHLKQIGNATIRVLSDTDILGAYKEISTNEFVDGMWKGSVTADAIFLGKANVFVQVDRPGFPSETSSKLLVVITRAKRTIDKIFIYSVISLVSILYINFGAALDLRKVKAVLRRPVGPTIAFCCHFIFLPLTSYILGILLFPNNAEMQLGLFFTGASPAGGASNTWTVILGGNIDLSITMSTTSTLSAFAMTPLWIFTLGKTIFDRGHMEVPYGQIASSVYGLIIPLAIGLAIQRYCPRVSRFLVRILKSCSALLITFIVIFAIVTNLYLFKLFTWEIILAGLLLPWIGYFIGWLLAIIFRQDYEDRMAIAVEAGIQNTGIAIFVLGHALNQPEADLTTVMPVSVAIMTPFPLIAFFICLKCREYVQRRRMREFPAEIKECIESQESGVY